MQLRCALMLTGQCMLLYNYPHFVAIITYQFEMPLLLQWSHSQEENDECDFWYHKDNEKHDAKQQINPVLIFFFQSAQPEGGNVCLCSHFSEGLKTSVWLGVLVKLWFGIFCFTIEVCVLNINSARLHKIRIRPVIVWFIFIHVFPTTSDTLGLSELL